MSRPGDAQAYPCGESGTVYGGLTKRELFAAMAMQGMAAWSGPESLEWTVEQVASKAVQTADALIAALETE